MQREKDDNVIRSLKVGDAISFVEAGFIGERRIGFVVKVTKRIIYISDSYSKNPSWFVRFGRRVIPCPKMFMLYVRVIPLVSYCAE